MKIFKIICFMMLAVCKMQGEAISINTFLEEAFRFPLRNIAKEEVMAVVSALQNQGHVVIQKGDDSEKALLFEEIQNAIEKQLCFWLKQGKIDKVVGVVHAPQPAAPLCSHKSMKAHFTNTTIDKNSKAFSVISRARTLQKYLQSGGVLFVAYPQEGLLGYTEAQREIYVQNLSAYPENLFDTPFEGSFSSALGSGASYLITMDTQKMLFSIRDSQEDISNGQVAELWLAPLEEQQAAERLQDLAGFFEEAGMSTLCNALL